MRTLTTTAFALAAVLVPATVLSGCGNKDTTLTVYAAASLQSSFTTIGNAFEKAHPGVKVVFDFDGSSTLVQQLQAGAKADVLATADQATMQSLGATATSPKTFATNVLEIAVPPSNPAHITSWTNLAKPGVKVVVCATPVPCGAATEQMEHVTHLTLKPVSEEQSVTDVLGKVEAGEADAGVVYVTDVLAAGNQVKGVPIAQAHRVVNTYPISTLSTAAQPTLAQQFVTFVLGARGQGTLKAAGFGAA